MFEADEIVKSMTLSQAKNILGDRAEWELKNMKKALTMLRAANSIQDETRLAAVMVMLKKRKR